MISDRREYPGGLFSKNDSTAEGKMAKPDYTLIDYVRWMGGFSFDERPFCDVDALALCDVIYFEIFEADTSKGKALRALIGAAPVDDLSIVKRVGGGLKEHAAFIRAVAASVRFGEITVEKYAEILDYEKSIQFAAAAFRYGNVFNFIAFRGTDDTIAGWKEDFMISFTRTAAQELALQFAEDNIQPGIDNYIGGHSKGGNLALYAAAKLSEGHQKDLTRVYDLDGPGFCGEVFDLNALNVIREKTTFIMPEFDVVGKLFEPDIPDKKIVASSETAVMQHELLSWGVKEEGLDVIPENDPRANTINRIIDDWVENISHDDRKIFVNDLFEALGADGAQTMTEIMESGLDGFEKILFKASGSSVVTKKAAAALPEQAIFGNILQNIRENGIWKFITTNKYVRAVLLIACGILFICASQNIISIAAMLFAAFLTAMQIGLTAKRLSENHWKFAMVRERLHLCAILIVLCICLLFKDQAFFLLGSVIFAIGALLISVQSGLQSGDKKSPVYRRILSGAECAVGVIYGLSFLIIPESTVFGFTISIGSGLVIDGVIRILFEIFESVKKRRVSD